VAGADFWIGPWGVPCTHASLSEALAAAAANGLEADRINLPSDYTETHSAELVVDLDATGDLVIAGGNLGCLFPGHQYPTRFEFSGPAGLVLLGGTSVPRAVSLHYLSFYTFSGSGPLLDVEGEIVAELSAGCGLSGGSAVEGALVRVTGPGAVLRFTDGGYGNSLTFGTATADGGAILVDQGTLEISGDTRFQSNTAGGRGGAVACRGGGTVLAAGAWFHLNSAAGGGGALFADACSLQVSSPTRIESNSTAGDGGALLAVGGSSVEIAGPEPPGEPFGELEPLEPMLSANQASRGGAVAAVGPGTVVQVHDLWLVDHAAASGGALFVSDGALASVARCRLLDNSAVNGGSLAVVEGPGSVLRLESDLVSGNTGAPLVRVASGASATAGFVTAVANALEGEAAFETAGAGSATQLYSSLSLDGRVFAAPAGGAVVSADCVAALDLTDFPAPPRSDSFLQVASAGEILHRSDGSSATLRVDSPATDFCDDAYYAPEGDDLEGDSRPFDQPPVGSDGFGLFDLGADESRGILLADHEEGDCGDWTSSTGCP
jgi:predicted outer membrane repeat protein